MLNETIIEYVLRGPGSLALHVFRKTFFPRTKISKEI